MRRTNCPAKWNVSEVSQPLARQGVRGGGRQQSRRPGSLTSPWPFLKVDTRRRPGCRLTSRSHDANACTFRSLCEPVAALNQDPFHPDIPELKEPAAVRPALGPLCICFHIIILPLPIRFPIGVARGGRGAQPPRVMEATGLSLVKPGGGAPALWKQ